MNCFKCQEEMMLKREEVTNNFKKGKNYKEYKRLVYWCKRDDIWVSFEIPIVTHLAASIVPDDLLMKLRAQTGLITLWDKLSSTTKRKYIKYVSDAEKEVTRSMRIEKIVKKILDQ